MNLCISNIAWNPPEDKEVYRLMNKYGFNGLEVAPVRTWDKPPDQITSGGIKSFLDELETFGISLIAFQAVLFGRPDLKIFDSKNKRKETLDFLKGIIRLAHRTGTRILVFGSPRNRDTGKLSHNAVLKIARDVFLELGEYAWERGVLFCIEPNPKEYNTNFINNTEQALNLLSEVNHPGFRLHIDTGTLIVNREIGQDVIRRASAYIAHLHVSEPYLEPVMPPESQQMHREIHLALKAVNYEGWISVEMKKMKEAGNTEVVERALQAVSDIYTH